MRKRFSLCKKVGVFLLTAVMCTSQLNVQAEKKYDFETEYQVVAGANGYFIAKNQKGEYGLLDSEGEKAVGFDYSEMEFPKDTMQYQYIKVKQNKNWGIVDYDENILVPLNFEKVSEYSNGNTIAAGYNGNTTYLYDLKGKEQKKQLTGSGSYSVISDTVFWGKEDIRNEKDNTLVKLEENKLLDKKKNSLVVKVGDTHYAVQRYTTQLTGNLETDQNIEVYEKDEKTQDILPEEEWVKDKDSTVKGSLKLIKAVSDKNIIADMQMDDGFKVIYNIEDGQSTSKYKSIGEFRDGKAFAVDMDNNIKIIDTSGKAINKNDIEVADYKENTDSLKSGTMTESELEKEKNQDIKKEGQTSFLKFENEKKDRFKLYSLTKEDVIKGTWKDVKFVGNDFVLLQNEDDKYGVIDKDGKTVVEFGKFSKDELLNASYCNSGITVVKQNGNKNDVYYYQTAKEVKKSFFEANKKIILFAGIGVAIFLVILCVIIALKKKAAAKAEEQRQQEKRQQDAQRRKPVSPKFQQPTIQPEPQRREKPPVKKPNVTSGKGTSIHSAVKASASNRKKVI
ncbi:hypothetical protein DW972_06925 [Anaerobutyricum hallii]|uniref:WG repeat-containing protein n=1 Tax=Anaerobutyricum hallii TaxID=39488 RepID=A0A413PYB0_9FIRM|nr:WG repeat-containing protein [Anaerobutyricum hallii]RGZ83175.1 hypothetical protein DW972_06925 [Anaerobutyricum hallii]